MPQNTGRRKDGFLVLHQAQILVHNLFIIYDRTDLQQIESRPCMIRRVHVDSELNLYRTAHFLLPDP